MMRKLRVGHSNQDYPEKRNIINKVINVDNVLLRDFYLLIRKIKYASQLCPTRAKDAEFKFSDYGLNKVDLIHLFNAVYFGRTPWISTYETIIPRFRSALDFRGENPEKLRCDSEVLRALDALSSASCKKIIAISEGTAKIQNEFLKLFPDHREEIITKQVVLHPPQEVLRDLDRSAYKIFSDKTPIRFIVVGHQFFSKGGREILSVFDSFQKKNVRPIQLVVVSKIFTDDYATCTGKDDVLIIKKFIEENKDWITYHPLLSPNDVLSLIKGCDVGLLPAYTETYGYTVLEYQSMGLPVVTTNIRSFPEINNNDVGWIIPIPKHYDGESRYKEPGGKENISKAIEEGLEKVLDEIMNNPNLIADKGKRAVDRIKTEHNPLKYASKLWEIYENAVNA